MMKLFYILNYSDYHNIDQQDVEHLMLSLRSNVKVYKTIENWNHMDFLFSQNGRIMLYDFILSQFNNDIDLLTMMRNVLTG